MPQVCPKCGQRFGEGEACPVDGTTLADAQVYDTVIGRTLGNYRIESLLGAGGMGTVFLARHVALGTAAVVKVLNPEVALHKGLKSRFFFEARHASGIKHPNVVRIYDFGETDDGLLYMVMEWVEGEDLEHTIRREGWIEPVRAARLLRQISSALETAHTGPDGPVIHRDLKPSNIRVVTRGAEEQAVVLDFGIAKALAPVAVPTGQTPKGVTFQDRVTQPGMVLGTPHYMAPEQIAGVAVDARTDVYALGIVAYQALTGDLPFDADQIIQVFLKQTNDPPPPFPAERAVPEPLQAIVLRCLEKKPEARFESAAALVAALDAFLADEASASLRRRSKIAVLVSLGVGVAIAAALAWAFRDGDDVLPHHVLELKKLAMAEGADATAADTLWVREEGVTIEGEIAGLETLAPHAPALSVKLAGEDVPGAGRKGERGFQATLSKLPPEGLPSSLDVTVSYEAPETGERREVRVMSKRLVRDATPPTIGIVPPTALGSYGLDAVRGEVYAARPNVRLEVDLDDTVSGLAPGSFLAEGEPPVRVGVAGASAGAGEGAGTGTAGGAPHVALALDLDLAALAPGARALLTLRASDVAGNHAERSVRVTFDPEPPFVAIRAVNGIEAAGDEVAIEGAPGAAETSAHVEVECSAGDRLELFATGPDGKRRPVTDWVSGGRHHADLVLRTEGTYELAAVASDKATNRAESVKRIRYAIRLEAELVVAGAMGGAPIGASADGIHYVAGDSVRIGGRATKPLASVAVRREAPFAEPWTGAAAVEDRTFKALVPLAIRDGGGSSAEAQAIVVRIVPEVGAAIDRSVRVVRDTTPPSIEVAVPAGPWPAVIGASLAPGGFLGLEAKVTDAGLAAPAFFLRADFEDEAAAAAAAAALAQVDAPVPPSVAVTPLEPGDGGVLARSIPLVDGKRLVVAFEARDRAGNVSRVVRRAAVDLKAPVLSIQTSQPVYRVHERVEVRITAKEALGRVTLDGRTDLLKRGTSDDEYVFETTMLLDTALEHRVEAEDAAGNRSAATVALAREDACSLSNPAGAKLTEAQRKLLLERPGTVCPHCRNPAVGGTGGGGGSGSGAPSPRPSPRGGEGEAGGGPP